MSFRFRKSVTLFPGVRLNFSKTGISVSAGVPGATVNLGRQGAGLRPGHARVTSFPSPEWPERRPPRPMTVEESCREQSGGKALSS
jgi:hypothetical protein